MIGIPALRSYLAGNFAELKLDAAPNAPLGTWSTPDAPVPPTGSARRDEKKGQPLFLICW